MTTLSYFVLLALVTMVTGNLFFNKKYCPLNCLDAACSLRGTCRTCKHGYCNTFKTCTTDCGSGKYCHALGFCTACKVRNCETCTAAQQCTECKRRYTLRDPRTCERESFWG